MLIIHIKTLDLKLITYIYNLYLLKLNSYQYNLICNKFVEYIAYNYFVGTITLS